MADDLRERLLVSFPDMGPAMVAQNVLEAGGVPCRIGDLAGLPQHVFGIAGAHARPVGLWVLEPDAERAAALLASADEDAGAIDDETLAAEALAAAPDPAGAPELPARHAPATRSGAPPLLGRATVALAIAALAGALVAYALG